MQNRCFFLGHDIRSGNFKKIHCRPLHDLFRYSRLAWQMWATSSVSPATSRMRFECITFELVMDGQCSTTNNASLIDSSWMQATTCWWHQLVHKWMISFNQMWRSLVALQLQVWQRLWPFSVRHCSAELLLSSPWPPLRPLPRSRSWWPGQNRSEKSRHSPTHLKLQQVFAPLATAYGKSRIEILVFGKCGCYNLRDGSQFVPGVFISPVYGQTFKEQHLEQVTLMLRSTKPHNGCSMDLWCSWFLEQFYHIYLVLEVYAEVNGWQCLWQFGQWLWHWLLFCLAYTAAWVKWMAVAWVVLAMPISYQVLANAPFAWLERQPAFDAESRGLLTGIFNASLATSQATTALLSGPIVAAFHGKLWTALSAATVVNCIVLMGVAFSSTLTWLRKRQGPDSNAD